MCSTNCLESIEKLWRDSIQSLVLAAAATAQLNTATCVSSTSPSNSLTSSSAIIGPQLDSGHEAISTNSLSIHNTTSPSSSTANLEHLDVSSCSTVSVLSSFLSSLMANIATKGTPSAKPKRKRKRKKRPQVDNERLFREDGVARLAHQSCGPSSGHLQVVGWVSCCECKMF